MEEYLNIVEYAKEYGDKTLEEEPFNEVDSLILTELSYLDFSKYVAGIEENKPAVLLSDIQKDSDYDHIFDIYFFRENNTELINNMVSSKRFKDIKLIGYCSILNEGKDAQFSAVTFILPDKSVYIAFRGTDITLLGWKEDIKLAYSRPVRAQELATGYLNEVAEKFAGDFRVGGHSKGGNLAVYAALHCKEAVRRRIIDIYNNDGPGLRPEIVDDEILEEIRDRIHKFIPKKSGVGILMEVDSDYKVIDSWGLGLMQHNPHTWKIDGNHLVEVTGMTRMKQAQDAVVNQWIYSLSEEELGAFIDALYDSLVATDSKNLFELAQNPIKNMETAVGTYRDMDKNTRDIMMKIMTRLVEITAEIAKDELEENISEGTALAKHGIEHIQVGIKEMEENARKMLSMLMNNKKDDE